MSAKTIWFDGDGLTLVSHNRAPGSFAEHLAEIRFGQGKGRYRRLGIDEQLTRFHQPHFLTLQRNDEQLATLVLDAQSLEWAGERVRAYYRGLLAVAPDYRRQGFGRTLTTQAMAWIDRRAAERGEPVFSYGCIDAGNEAAWRLLESQGAAPIGTLNTWVKYRQRRGTTITNLAVTDGLTPCIEAAWQRQTENALLRPAVAPRDHWIAVEDGGAVAACRHRLTTLDLTPQGGLTGLITERLMLLFPPGRARFNPSRFSYVSISDVVATRDSAHLWRRLIPHLMARHETHFVAITGDADSEAMQRLMAAGVISGKGREVRVMGRWHGGEPPRSGVDGHVAVAAPDL